MTVVSEKSLPRAANVPPTPPRSSTFGSSANQRLKGLLSGRSPTFDKALPTLVQTSSAPTPPPSANPPRSTNQSTPRTASPEAIETNKVNGGGGVLGGDQIRTGALTPTPPLEDNNSATGTDHLETSFPVLDLHPVRAAEYGFEPTQTGLLDSEVMSPPPITSSTDPNPDSDNIEGSA